MATSTASFRGSSSRIFWVAFLTTWLTLTMIVGVALAATPELGLIPKPAPPTARPQSWAAANIAKPTYTPSPVSTSTPTLLPTPTAIAPTDVPTEAPTEAPAEVPTDASQINLSIVDTQQSTQQSDVAASGKYVLVSISEQHLYAYENGQLVYSFVASTGMGGSTRTGTFSVLDKIPNAYGSTWNIWMPNWLGIYYVGTLEDGIHALPILPGGARLWSGYLGTPISFGCVVLGVQEAAQLYDWVDVGTPVVIRH